MARKWEDVKRSKLGTERADAIRSRVQGALQEERRIQGECDAMLHRFGEALAKLQLAHILGDPARAREAQRILEDLERLGKEKGDGDA